MCGHDFVVHVPGNSSYHQQSCIHHCPRKCMQWITDYEFLSCSKMVSRPTHTGCLLGASKGGAHTPFYREDRVGIKGGTLWEIKSSVSDGSELNTMKSVALSR